ncbi:MAG TPA: hypothetical protein VFL96_10865 [Acidobacteriaceae bacterium]|nr:hypothetical protein [Acidobacteriaceae bacterium]
MPRPVGRALSSAEFWTLMARWKVSDQMALDLIGFPGKVGRSGKRPRFRFSTKQRRITSYLAEIDAALDAIGRDPSWLHRRSRAALSGQSPIDHMISAGESGVAEVLRVLNHAAMKAALAR